MFIGLTNLSYKKISFINLTKKLNENSINYIEAAPSLLNKNFDKNKKLIKKVLNKNKIKIISLQSIFFKCKKININSDEDFFYLINHFKKIVKFCYYLNVKNISLGSCPSRKEISNKKKLYEYNLKLFSKFAEIAYNKNIFLNIEPISKKYQNFFLNNSHQALKFIKKIKRKNLKLVLDTGNCKNEKVNFKSFFLKNKHFIGHIQISDKNIKSLKIEEANKELKFFKKNKFNKTIAIEYISNYGLKMSQINKILLI